jgi:hypothetical protein
MSDPFTLCMVAIIFIVGIGWDVRERWRKKDKERNYEEYKGTRKNEAKPK